MKLDFKGSRRNIHVSTTQCCFGNDLTVNFCYEFVSLLDDTRNVLQCLQLMIIYVHIIKSFLISFEYLCS